MILLAFAPPIMTWFVEDNSLAKDGDMEGEELGALLTLGCKLEVG
jgi:hypothetical protein